MAIAKATCTCATCGCTFEVRAQRANRRDADSFEKWAATNIIECDDCANKRIQAARNAENAEAARAAKEMNYPELKGTEKQVAWANTIREKALAVLRDDLMNPEAPEYMRLAYTGVSYLLLKNHQAAWWIDHNNELRYAHVMLRLATQRDPDFSKAVGALQKAVQDGEKSMADAEREMTVLMGSEAPVNAQQEQKPAEQPVPERPEAVPETRKHDGSADIRISDGAVTAMYARNDRFMEIVKGMGFIWQGGCWQIESGERTGKVEDISAELGSRLLNAGFAVRFDSQEIMDKAVCGDYEPMCRRWITSHSGGFFIIWGREDDHYRAAKSLPGAVYDRPGVIVPERSWDALTDFADRYGYRFTAKAQEKMDRLSGAAQPVAPAPVKKPEYDEKDVLKSSREVLDDLKDDDT